jgi:hypothetical protein
LDVPDASGRGRTDQCLGVPIRERASADPVKVGSDQAPGSRNLRRPMARWRIFGRKGKRKGGPEATPTVPTDSGDDPATALYPKPPSADPRQEPGRFDTGDWEHVPEPEPGPDAEPDAEKRVRRVPAAEPDTGTAEWAPPSRVDSRRGAGAGAEQPAESSPAPPAPPDAEAEAEPAPAAPETPETDTGERIKAAADVASQAAEMRSHDEILALEKNLEQAQEAARAEVEAMAVRLREAEARSRGAQERADNLAAERADFEAKTREEATRWLRGQVIKLKADAQERVREEVERIRAEAEAGSGDPGVAATADSEGLRSELRLAREETAARVDEARESGKREALEAGGDADERLQAARAAGRAEAEAEMERNDEPRRHALEQRALAAAEAKTNERIARIEADADERIRAEVSVARKAAEDRFTELLSSREKDLEEEREEKSAAIERSHERLSQIERQAIAAAERVGVAEQELEAEKVRLREESAAQLEVAIEQAKAVAEQASAERMRDREEELDDAIAAAEQAEREAQSKVEEAKRQAAESEERSRAVEAEAAATISEVRQAAADWLRDQTKALRTEGSGDAERTGGSED